jgi:TfoX/Sxy family transcriptional regulator of competence genes
MSYDAELAGRVRAALGASPGLDEKKMFGGVGFLVHGNMACGVHGQDLIVRVGPDRYPEALTRPHARPFDLTGRPMSGWVTVTPAGCENDEQLEGWVSQGVAFARSLPAK